MLKFTDNKNEQMKRVFWTLFVAMAGQVLARVVDPGTAQQVVGIITGMGVKPSFRFTPVEECWDQGIQTRRENKPYTGFFSLHPLRVSTGKPRIISFFCSYAEYANLTPRLPK